MERKILKTVVEQEESLVNDVRMFNDTEEYTVEDIAPAFAGFSSRFSSFEEAIDNLPVFVDEFYSGVEVVRFKDTIRTGFRVIVRELLDAERQNLERRVVKSI